MLQFIAVGVVLPCLFQPWRICTFNWLCNLYSAWPMF